MTPDEIANHDLTNEWRHLSVCSFMAMPVADCPVCGQEDGKVWRDWVAKHGVDQLDDRSAVRVPMTIVFHGTNEDNVNAILANGFNSGTYFAAHLEDALEFGGSWVFEVALTGIKPGGWQYRKFEKVSADQIVSLTHHALNKVFDNPELRRRVLESNQEEN